MLIKLLIFWYVQFQNDMTLKKKKKDIECLS